VRRLVAVTERSWSRGIRRIRRDSGRGNGHGSAVVQVAADCGRDGVVGDCGVVVFVVRNGRGGGSSCSCSWIGRRGGGAGHGGSAGTEFVQGVHRLVVRGVHVTDHAAAQRYVQLERSGAIGLLRRRVGGRGGRRLVRRGTRQHRESPATHTSAVHGIQLLDQKVPLGRLVDLDHLDAPAHTVGAVTVRTLVERRGDEHRLGRDPPTGRAATDAAASGAHAAGGQRLVPRRWHQLFLDDDPAADVLVLALLEVRGRPAGQQQQQQGAQTQRSGHAS